MKRGEEEEEKKKKTNDAALHVATRRGEKEKRSATPPKHTHYCMHIHIHNNKQEVDELGTGSSPPRKACTLAGQNIPFFLPKTTPTLRTNIKRKNKHDVFRCTPTATATSSTHTHTHTHTTHVQQTAEEHTPSRASNFKKNFSFV